MNFLGFNGDVSHHQSPADGCHLGPGHHIYEENEMIEDQYTFVCAYLFIIFRTMPLEKPQLYLNISLFAVFSVLNLSRTHCFGIGVDRYV